ncbi:DNA-damage-inducible protein F, partial [hydrothermal vent metagenome]
MASHSSISLNRNILRLAVPNIISNLTVPLLGMADFALMGHLK